MTVDQLGGYTFESLGLQFHVPVVQMAVVPILPERREVSPTLLDRTVCL
jgi:hypothetical protein